MSIQSSRERLEHGVVRNYTVCALVATVSGCGQVANTPCYSVHSATTCVAPLSLYAEVRFKCFAYRERRAQWHQPGAAPGGTLITVSRLRRHMKKLPELHELLISESVQIHLAHLSGSTCRRGSRNHSCSLRSWMDRCKQSQCSDHFPMVRSPRAVELAE